MRRGPRPGAHVRPSSRAARAYSCIGRPDMGPGCRHPFSTGPTARRPGSPVRGALLFPAAAPPGAPRERARRFAATGARPGAAPRRSGTLPRSRRAGPSHDPRRRRDPAARSARAAGRRRPGEQHAAQRGGHADARALLRRGARRGLARERVDLGDAALRDGDPVRDRPDRGAGARRAGRRARCDRAPARARARRGPERAARTRLARHRGVPARDRAGRRARRRRGALHAAADPEHSLLPRVPHAAPVAAVPRDRAARAVGRSSERTSSTWRGTGR